MPQLSHHPCQKKASCYTPLIRTLRVNCRFLAEVPAFRRRERSVWFCSDGTAIRFDLRLSTPLPMISRPLLADACMQCLVAATSKLVRCWNSAPTRSRPWCGSTDKQRLLCPLGQASMKPSPWGWKVVQPNKRLRIEPTLPTCRSACRSDTFHAVVCSILGRRLQLATESMMQPLHDLLPNSGATPCLTVSKGTCALKTG